MPYMKGDLNPRLSALGLLLSVRNACILKNDIMCKQT